MRVLCDPWVSSLPKPARRYGYAVALKFAFYVSGRRFAASAKRVGPERIRQAVIEALPHLAVPSQKEENKQKGLLLYTPFPCSVLTKKF